MTDYATLTDTVAGTTVSFMMQGAWTPTIHEEAQLYYPLDYGFAVKLTNGVKGVGGSLTIVSTSTAMDVTVKTLLESPNALTLTLPTGDSYTIMWDAQDRHGSSQFSLMGWNPVTIWTATYFQVS